MRNIQLAKGLSSTLPQIIDVTDELPRIKTWEELSKPYRDHGEWDGVTYHTGLRNPEDITMITIHHSGPPEGTLVSHAKFHSRKWGAGIAYHIAIDEGRIKQLNDLLSFTYHVGNHNTYSVGIVVNADLSKREMNSQERELLYGAIMSVKAVLPITQILGHNELNPTQCPCTSMNQIRTDIQSLEEQIAYAESPANLNAELYATTLRYNDLWSKFANKDGKWSKEIQAEAERKLSVVNIELRKQGWMN